VSDKLPIMIVNEADKPVGSATKHDAWVQGLIHRISEVMVENHEGLILLQKRAIGLETNPGCWTTSVGAHVDAGETYLEAATREMQEEIGLNGIGLQVMGSYRKDSMYEWRQLKRFYTVFKTIVPKDTIFQPDPSEVSEVRWFKLTEIKQLIEVHQEQFTPGLIEVIKRFYS